MQGVITWQRQGEDLVWEMCEDAPWTHQGWQATCGGGAALTTKATPTSVDLLHTRNVARAQVVKGGNAACMAVIGGSWHALE